MGRPVRTEFRENKFTTFTDPDKTDLTAREGDTVGFTNCSDVRFGAKRS